MSQYFRKLFKNFRGNINFKVALSNYAIKAVTKNVSHVDASSFVLKANLYKILDKTAETK